MLILRLKRGQHTKYQASEKNICHPIYVLKLWFRKVLWEMYPTYLCSAVNLFKSEKRLWSQQTTHYPCRGSSVYKNAGNKTNKINLVEV